MAIDKQREPSAPTTSEGRRRARERFVRLTDKRVNRGIRDLQLESNLANRFNYDYSEEEGELILRALEAELKQLRQTFSRSPRTDKPFSLHRN